MKKLYLFLILSVVCFSCSQREDTENESEDTFFDFDFFDDTEEEDEEVIEEEVIPKPSSEKPKLETPTIEVDQEEEQVIENKEELVLEEVEEIVEEIEEEVVREDKLIIVDYQEFRVRFKTTETFDVNEIDFEEKLKNKGLLKRYKTQQSYFDIYDIDKAINWSGAGDFAEFGQGFYERSKEVYSGKYVNFAKRKAFMFHTKISFAQDLNYSNIKKLKSDHEVHNDHKVDAVVVFFGKGNYGYRYIYQIGNQHAELTSQTMEAY
ncbi:hypothetical protein [Flammeovirga sp. EKP202]|uniref:hypothetical protein n=1 Tax=Flammeovirga sp. EKP202 TaxID=2770592 RepID=UPI00165FFC68|nr:hypothetical protein [Flammeovirga sp. EKP202]MBD0402577.1 hypothetical protein [Flammeovirga sp. EKP202]